MVYVVVLLCFYLRYSTCNSISSGHTTRIPQQWFDLYDSINIHSYVYRFFFRTRVSHTHKYIYKINVVVIHLLKMCVQVYTLSNFNASRSSSGSVRCNKANISLCVYRGNIPMFSVIWLHMQCYSHYSRSGKRSINCNSRQTRICLSCLILGLPAIYLKLVRAYAVAQL